MKKKITKNHYIKTFAVIQFMRSYWHIMSKEQKYYLLYRLTKNKRKYVFKNLSYLYNIKLIYKEFSLYKKSKFDQKIYNYLKLIWQAILFQK